MSGHRQAAPTPSGGREKRPSGRPCGPFGRRRAALVMRPASRRTTLLAEKPARPSDVAPSYESKYSARAAWRCLSIGKGAQRRHGVKEPGHRSRQNGPSGASRRSPDAPHRASRRSYPRDRFAAIKLLPAGRIVLWAARLPHVRSVAGRVPDPGVPPIQGTWAESLPARQCGGFGEEHASNTSGQKERRVNLFRFLTRRKNRRHIKPFGRSYAII